MPSSSHQSIPELAPLRTAVNDARAIDTILRERYGFQTNPAVDGAATRTNILNAFGDYRPPVARERQPADLLRRHGARDGNDAYWLPVDSYPDSTATGS